MPIDKGGRHMLTRRQIPYPADSIVSANPLSSFYLCKPTDLYSPCLIQIRSTFLKQEQRYLLETGGVDYISPISGKIDSVRLSDNSKILLNERPIEIASIKNTYIQKGDKISFTSPDGQPEHALIEILVLCPVKNE